MSKFDLERRAEELAPSANDGPWRSWEVRNIALQLARELAEVIAAECRGYDWERLVSLTAARDVAVNIARSFVRPRTREDVYREALEGLERVARNCSDTGANGPLVSVWAAEARRALDWRQP